MSGIETFTPSILEVTENAVAKVQSLKLEEDNEELKLRVYVTGGGCSGFQYKFSIDGDKMDDDIVLNNTTSTGATVTTLIDSMSLELIAGGQLEFVNELAGQYFQVVNPNATAACGCGTSFAL